MSVHKKEITDGLALKFDDRNKQLAIKFQEKNNILRLESIKLLEAELDLAISKLQAETNSIVLYIDDLPAKLKNLSNEIWSDICKYFTDPDNGLLLEKKVHCINGSYCEVGNEVDVLVFTRKEVQRTDCNRYPKDF